MNRDPRKGSFAATPVYRPALKICGLRQPTQARAIAALGVEAIGVIGVPTSPRHVPPGERPPLFAAVAETAPHCLGVLVVADPGEDELPWLEAGRGHQVLQLHGRESPEHCEALRHRLGVSIWKALRIRGPRDLDRAQAYAGSVDAVLLDAWVPDQLGGTGQRLPLEWLQGFRPPLAWWLAGGITPDNAVSILSGLEPRPHGLDVSSGVENAPADKNLAQVQRLLRALSGSAGTPAA